VVPGNSDRWIPRPAVDHLAEEPDFGPDTESLCQSFMTPICLERRYTACPCHGNLRYRAQLGHSRFYLGADLHKSSGLPDPGLWRYAPLARFLRILPGKTARRTIPGVGGWIDQVHRKARREYLNKHLEGGTQSSSRSTSSRGKRSTVSGCPVRQPGGRTQRDQGVCSDRGLGSRACPPCRAVPPDRGTPA